MRTTKNTHKLKLLNSVFNDEYPTVKDFMKTFFNQELENITESEYISEDDNDDAILNTAVNDNIKHIEVISMPSTDDIVEQSDTREQRPINISNDVATYDHPVERDRSELHQHICSNVVPVLQDDLVQKINRRNVENHMNNDKTLQRLKVDDVQHVDIQLVHQTSGDLAKQSENWLCGKSVTVIDEDGKTIAQGVVQELSDFIIITSDGHLIVRGHPFKVDLTEGTDLSLENIVVGQDKDGRIILDMAEPESPQRSTRNMET